MQGDIFGVVVPRNTPIPTNKSRTFTTVEDNQTQVTFPVYEGERTQCKDNRLLGEFELSGIAPMPRGQAELVYVLSCLCLGESTSAHPFL